MFTTRHDTIFGASFMAISPEHPLAAHLAQKNEELAAFIEECRKIGTTEEALAKAEKKGFDTGIVAVHPFKPDVKLPVYVANFIVMGYGTGAIFGCPGARPARSGFRPQIRASGGAGGAAAGGRRQPPSASATRPTSAKAP